MRNMKRYLGLAGALSCLSLVYGCNTSSTVFKPLARPSAAPSAAATPAPQPLSIAQIFSEASYVGSDTCLACHASVYNTWRDSWHNKVIQPIAVGNVSTGTPPATVKTNSGAVAKAPDAAVVFSQGGRWKQRYITWDNNKNTGSNSVYGQWDVATLSGAPNWTKNGGETNDWSKDCAWCHVTGMDTKALKEGKYIWKEMAVGCETCHGPASLHVKASTEQKKLTIIQPNRMTKEQAATMCGACHNRGQTIGTNYKFPIDYVFGDPLPANWTTNSATGVNFWKDTDGTILGYQQHRMQYPDFINSKHYRNVACHDCHNQHTLQIKNDVKTNDLCYSCHSDKKPPNLTAHTKHSADNITDDRSAGSRCVSCHMVKMDKTVYSFDERNHTFKVINPKKGPDNMPNSCMSAGVGSCHGVNVSGNHLDFSTTVFFTQKADGTLGDPPGGKLKDAKAQAYASLKTLWPTYTE